MSEPLLFIDSFKELNEATSNQDYYDSRVKTNKDKARHRLEDIEAMLYYRIHVLAEIHTKQGNYEGVVLECNNNGLLLQIENDKVNIPIYEIESINILKL